MTFDTLPTQMSIDVTSRLVHCRHGCRLDARQVAARKKFVSLSLKKELDLCSPGPHLHLHTLS